jgi:hypothetical protein
VLAFRSFHFSKAGSELLAVGGELEVTLQTRELDGRDRSLGTSHSTSRHSAVSIRVFLLNFMHLGSIINKKSNRIAEPSVCIKKMPCRISFRPAYLVNIVSAGVVVAMEGLILIIFVLLQVSAIVIIFSLVHGGTGPVVTVPIHISNVVLSGNVRSKVVCLAGLTLFENVKGTIPLFNLTRQTPDGSLVTITIVIHQGNHLKSKPLSLGLKSVALGSKGIGMTCRRIGGNIPLTFGAPNIFKLACTKNSITSLMYVCAA